MIGTLMGNPGVAVPPNHHRAPACQTRRRSLAWVIAVGGSGPRPETGSRRRAGIEPIVFSSTEPSAGFERSMRYANCCRGWAGDRLGFGPPPPPGEFRVRVTPGTDRRTGRSGESPLFAGRWIGPASNNIANDRPASDVADDPVIPVISVLRRFFRLNDSRTPVTARPEARPIPTIGRSPWGVVATVFFRHPS
jgi:hypothetical protein